MQAVETFAKMMIERMEEMKGSDWQRGWIGGSASGMPQNVTGRNYSGSNSFFLMLLSFKQQYELPIFMTFSQAHNYGAHILKGEQSIPVIYWDFNVKDKQGNRIPYEEYKKMDKAEQAKYVIQPFIRSYPVFNIAQTNFKEVQPEKYQKLIDKFKLPEADELKDTKGMFTNMALDSMVAQQEWVCPIHADKPSPDAYYSPSSDMIVIPMKAQFNKGETADEIYADGMEYYSTMLHEMTHSTMTAERLNRESGGKFGDEKYAKEELVAELTAAMIGNTMGFESRVTDNSVAYLDAWISTLKEEPKFLLSVMADVNKASEMILDHVDKQSIKIGAPTYLAKNDPQFIDMTEEICPFKDAGILKQRSGEFAVRASYQGVDLGMKQIDRDTAKRYFRLTDQAEKLLFLGQTVKKTFKDELASISRGEKVTARNEFARHP
jgi:antirestriction protein ArdC